MTEPIEDARTAEYGQPVLFLIGSWERPNNAFQLRATILVGTDGRAEGRIYWQAVLVHGRLASYFATEYVRGSVLKCEVHLEGYKVEGLVARDEYRITLEGKGDSGPFGGVTKTHLNNWAGRIGGSYLFKNRTTCGHE